MIPSHTPAPRARRTSLRTTPTVCCELCAPVFDADGRLVPGLVTMGAPATLDAAWNGAIDRSLRLAARQLSHELGQRDA